MKKLNFTKSELELIYISLDMNKSKLKKLGWDKEYRGAIKNVREAIPNSRYIKVKLSNDFANNLFINQ